MILNDIDIFYTEGGSLSDCLTKINNLREQNNLLNTCILKLSVFINAQSNEEYNNAIGELTSEIEAVFNKESIPVSIIAQKPQKSDISIEAFILKKHSYKVSRKKIKNIIYSVVESKNEKLIFAAGLNEKQKGVKNRILAHSKGAFDLMKDILDNENLNFSNIIRQWNYIENILNVSKNGQYLYQNYQIFNDVRSSYYSIDSFENGYPSATGIGMNSGGVVIEFIALQNNLDYNILPISNPLQCNAYSYSKDVLFENALGNENTLVKTTPKFERGKLISYQNEHYLFVSGTASIQKEKTIGTSDIKKQTEVTLNNIQNVINSFIDLNKYKKKFSYYRVYLKYMNDYYVAKVLCDEFFKNVPGQYLYSDICRSDLLVEIECGLVIN